MWVVRNRDGGDPIECSWCSGPLGNKVWVHSEDETLIVDHFLCTFHVENSLNALARAEAKQQQRQHYVAYLKATRALHKLNEQGGF